MSTVTKYKIYIVNDNTSEQTFWLFLSQPEGLEGQQVYANSSAFMTIDPGYEGEDYFDVPVQYIVGAGASNHPVGLGVEISSSVTEETALGVEWNIQYADPVMHKGPTMTNNGPAQNTDQIWLDTLSYDQGGEGTNNWYANQSFGIQTDAGYIGMTWSPSAGQTRKLTPKLNFYVATGTYGANELASWEDVSDDCAVIAAPSNFDASNEATVTYTSSGQWIVTKGKPVTAAPAPISTLAMMHDLARSHRLLSEAHLRLVAAATQGSVSQDDTVTKVHWNNTEGGWITGTITVTTALAAAFVFFTCSGVTFHVTGILNGVNVNFMYNGTLSVEALERILHAGSRIAFQGAV